MQIELSQSPYITLSKETHVVEGKEGWVEGKEVGELQASM